MLAPMRLWYRAAYQGISCALHVNLCQKWQLTELLDRQIAVQLGEEWAQPIAIERNGCGRMPDQTFSLSKLLGQQLLRRPPLRPFELKLQGHRLGHPMGMKGRPNNLRFCIVRTCQLFFHARQKFGDATPTLPAKAEAEDAVKATALDLS